MKVTRNIFTILTALVLSIGIWAFAVERTTDKITVGVTVRLKLAPDTDLHTELQQQKVELTLKGPRGLLAGFQSTGFGRDGFIATIDRKDLPPKIPSEMTHPIRLGRKHMPNINPGLSLEFKPEVVTIKLSPIRGFKLPIEPVINEALPRGYRIDKTRITCQPRFARVWGPVNLYEGDTPPPIKTETIELGSITGAQVLRIPNVKLKTLVNDKPVKTNTTVTVSIPIERDQISVDIADVPVFQSTLGSFPHRVKLLDQTVVVKVKGVPEDVDILKKDPTRILAAVIIRDQEPGLVPYKLPLTIVFPSDLDVELDGDPPSVRFDVKKTETAIPPT